MSATLNIYSSKMTQCSSNINRKTLHIIENTDSGVEYLPVCILVVYSVFAEQDQFFY